MKRIFNNDLISSYIDVLNMRSKSVCLVMENIMNPKNILNCYKVADGYGLHNIHLIKTIPTKRVTSKADLEDIEDIGSKLNIERFESIDVCLTNLKDQGYIILASCLTPTSVNLTTLMKQINQFIKSSIPKIALVAGNETNGLSEDILKQCDYNTYIPMMGLCQSFNVYVAVSIFLNTFYNHGLIHSTSTIAKSYKLDESSQYVDYYSNKLEQFMPLNLYNRLKYSHIDALEAPMHPLSFDEKIHLLKSWIK